MLSFNIPCNIIYIYLGYKGFLSTGVHDKAYYNSIACSISYIYFPLDTLIEIIKHKQYIYIPHHLISLFAAYKIHYTTDISLINIIPYILMYGESTSLITNIRQIIKANKMLTTSVDSTLWATYMITRNALMTSVIYPHRQNKILWYSWLSILGMSNIWGYKWLRNIIKYNNSNNNNNQDNSTNNKNI